MSECGKKIGTIVAGGVEKDIVCGLEAHDDSVPHEAKPQPQPSVLGRGPRQPKAEAKEG